MRFYYFDYLWYNGEEFVMEPEGIESCVDIGLYQLTAILSPRAYYDEYDEQFRKFSLTIQVEIIA